MRTAFVAAFVALAALLFAGSPAEARKRDRGWEERAYTTTTVRRRSARSARYTSRRAGRRTAAGRRSARRGYAYRGGDSGSYAGGGATGVASFYWQPQRVASGGWFNPNAMTAAHKTLPFGTRVRVTHLRNGRSVVVTINDRGPYIAGRIIDLSKAAAGVIGMQGQGIAQVRMDVIGR